MYDQGDTLLLADVFETFGNICLKIYDLNPGHFFSVPGLAWQASLKKAKIKLELLTDIDMFLTLGKSIRGEICHEFIDM